MNGDQVSENLKIKSIPVRGNDVAIPFNYILCSALLVYLILL